MNLHDYFSSQKQERLDPESRVALYETIVRTREHTRAFFASPSFYAKVGLYMCVGLLFFVSLYAPYVSSLLHESDGVLTSVTDHSAVQADYIAQIIETTGDITIYQDGQKVQSSLLRVGDTITLASGGEIVFHLSSVAQAKITGPAQFSLEDGDGGYTISLMSGNYAELQSLTPSTTGQQAGYVTLRAPHANIQSTSPLAMHFTYTDNGQQATVTNQGGDTLLVAKDSTTSGSLVAINTIAQIGSGTGIQMVAATGQQLAFASSGDMVSPVKAVPQRMTPMEVAKALQAPTTGSTAVSKTMLTLDQHDHIKAILTSSFLQSDIQQATAAYLKGDQRTYDAAFTNIYNKLAEVYDILGLPIDPTLTAARTTSSPQVMINLIENLINGMQDNFYVAHLHYVILKGVLAWAYALQAKGFGSYQHSDLTGTQLLQELPLSDYQDLMQSQ